MKYLYFAFIILCIPFGALAQITEEIITQGPTLAISPTFPEPLSPVMITVDDYASVTTVSGITWKINGQVISDSQNLRSITLTAPEAGKSTKIEAVLQSGSTASTLTTTITPQYIDLLVEPQTKSPAFYKGRSLPSIGSLVQVTALLSDTTLSSNDLLYTWRLNNTVLNGGAIRGGTKTIFTIPMGQLHLVSVDIAKLDGTLVTQRTVEIPSVTPHVRFYEHNALYGLIKRSFTNNTLTGSTITLKAEPYHLDLQTYNNPDVLTWEIDGKDTINTNTNPYEITLTRPYEGFAGSSRVSFHVRNLTQLLQGGEGEFRLNF